MSLQWCSMNVGKASTRDDDRKIIEMIEATRGGLFQALDGESLSAGERQEARYCAPRRTFLDVRDVLREKHR